MLRYKLIKAKKRNSDDMIYYPNTINDRVITNNDILDEMERNATFKKSDAIGVLAEFREIMLHHLRAGDIVEWAPLGRFKLHVCGRSVSDPKLFKPQRDITGIRCCFHPSSSSGEKEMYRNLKCKKI